MKARIVFLTLVFALTSLPVFGGVVYSMQVETLTGPDPGVMEGTISVEGKRIHLNTDPDAKIIFDGDVNRMYIINEEEQNYIVFDRESVDRMTSKINSAMEQMKKQLEQMKKGQGEGEAICLSLTIRQYPPAAGIFDPLESFENQCRLAREFMDEKIIPNFVQPLTETIAQKRLT